MSPSELTREFIQNSIISALTDSLIGEPREVRILQVIIWASIGIILWGYVNALRILIITCLGLPTSFIVTVILYKSANKSVNELMNDITPINELLTKPGNIIETIKQLERGNIIDNINKIIKNNKGIKEVLRYLPISLLPFFTAAFAAFPAAFTMDMILHPLTNISSYDAKTVGTGITVLTALTLTMISLTTKTTETTNQRPREPTQDNHPMANHLT